MLCVRPQSCTLPAGRCRQSSARPWCPPAACTSAAAAPRLCRRRRRSARPSGAARATTRGAATFAAAAPLCDSVVAGNDDAATCSAPQLGWALGFAHSFTLHRVVGSGSFGVVHEATHNATGLRYAVKVLNKQRKGRNQLDAIRREVAVWAQAQGSQYVARLVGLYEDEARAYIVQELCTGGDLRDLLRARGRLPEAQAAAIMRGVLDMLVQCHRCGVVYGDLKPANFLLLQPSGSGGAADAGAASTVRAVDFGCSHRARGDPRGPCRGGTPLYSAPEAPMLRRASVAVDVWAAGVMVYQLLTGRLPFWQNKTLDDVSRLPPYEVLAAVRTHDIGYPREVWEGLTREARDLVGLMLQRNPGARISAEAALAHPWFARVLGYTPAPSGQDEEAGGGGGGGMPSTVASIANNVVDFTGGLRRAPAAKGVSRRCGDAGELAGVPPAG